MLELQRFLFQHRHTWKRALSNDPYNLKIKEKGNLVLFKYSQIESNFSFPLVQEARGIILERDTWKVVSISFNKFFNLDEPFAAQIDWRSAIATEKMDGSLMTVYFYDGEWRVKTNGTIDAEDAELDSPPFKNFRELFDVAAQNSGLDYSKLNKSKSYTFELCSKYNKVVLQYDEPKLYHILTRDNYAPYNEWDDDIGVEKPHLYAHFLKNGYEGIVSDMDDTHEGIVVRDIYGNRVKIKTEHWLRLHYLSNSLNTSSDKLIEAVLNNDVDELLAYFPEYKMTIANIKVKLALLAEEIESLYTYDFLYDGIPSRKEIAKSIQRDMNKLEQSMFWLIHDKKVSRNLYDWDLKMILKFYHKSFDNDDYDYSNDEYNKNELEGFYVSKN